MNKQRIALGLIFAVVFFGLEAVAIAASPDWAWTRVASVNGNGNAQAGRGITVDADGGIYVVGHISRMPLRGGRQPWVGKYGPMGNLLWQDVAPADEYGEATDVTVGADGSVYVTGFLIVADESQFIMLRKFDALGQRQWTQLHNSPANRRDVGSAVALDAAGNIYEVGTESRPDLEQSSDAWIGKYDPDGNLLWSRRFAGEGRSSDEPRGVVVDAQGRITVLSTTRAQIYRRIWLRHYDTAGTLLWDQVVDQVVTQPNDLAADAEGNLFVVGPAPDTESHDVWLGKFDSSGSLLWARSYDDPDHNTDYGYAVAVDSQGNAYITGQNSNPDFEGGANLRLLAYAADGTLLWQEVTRGLAERGVGIAVDDNRKSISVVGDFREGILTANFLLPTRPNAIVTRNQIGLTVIPALISFEGATEIWEFGHLREGGIFEPATEGQTMPVVGTAYRLAFRKRRDQGDIIVPLDHKSVLWTRYRPVVGDESFENFVFTLDYNMNGHADMEVDVRVYRHHEGFNLVHVAVE